MNNTIRRSTLLRSSWSTRACELAAALGALVAGGNVDGAVSSPLLIDFQGVGGNTRAGYQSYEAVNQDTTTLGPRNYVSPISATVEIKVANLPDGSLDFRVVDRGPSASPDVEDWIGVDARLGPPGSFIAGNPRPTMNVIVSNLADGVYRWSSLHHDPINQTGVVSYVFTAADGASSGTIDISSGSEPMTTFDRTFRSAGGAPVTLSLTVTEPAGTGRFAASASFALINSLQITPIPEPHTLALFAVGAALTGAFCRYRR
jgi:PEP-CTERM motif